jgi:hypothetical protein
MLALENKLGIASSTVSWKILCEIGVCNELNASFPPQIYMLKP